MTNGLVHLRSYCTEKLCGRHNKQPVDMMSTHWPATTVFPQRTGHIRMGRGTGQSQCLCDNQRENGTFTHWKKNVTR